MNSGVIIIHSKTIIEQLTIGYFWNRLKNKDMNSGVIIIHSKTIIEHNTKKVAN